MDKSGIWNLEELSAGTAFNMSTKIILFGYMWMETHVESMLNIRGTSRDLATMGINEKKINFRTFSQYLHKMPRQDNLYCFKPNQWTVLHPALTTEIIFFENKVGHIFIPKFYHDKKDTSFLKLLSYVEEHGLDNSLCEFPEIGRKY